MGGKHRAGRLAGGPAQPVLRENKIAGGRWGVVEWAAEQCFFLEGCDPAGTACRSASTRSAGCADRRCRSAGPTAAPSLLWPVDHFGECRSGDVEQVAVFARAET